MHRLDFEVARVRDSAAVAATPSSTSACVLERKTHTAPLRSPIFEGRCVLACGSLYRLACGAGVENAHESDKLP